MILPGSSETRFVLNHMNGSCPVEYEVTGWLKAAREGVLSKSMGPFLMDSKKFAFYLFIDKTWLQFISLQLLIFWQIFLDRIAIPQSFLGPKYPSCSAKRARLWEAPTWAGRWWGWWMHRPPWRGSRAWRGVSPRALPPSGKSRSVSRSSSNR